MEVPSDGLGVACREVTTAEEVFGVLCAGAFFVVDDVVHLRLSHRRVVGFVVAAAAVAHEVNEDVFAKAASILGGQFAHPDHGFGVVAVDVEDGAAVRLGQVGSVVAGPAGIRGGGEADLVVHHNVDCAADGVAAQLRQVNGFRHDSQSCECGIAMQQQRNNGVAVVAFVQDVLLGANNTLHDGVDGFQVRGVGRERNFDFAVAEHLDVLAFRTQVVFHIAGTTGLGRVHVAFELVEQDVERLAHNVGQHVQAATVRHTNDYLIKALACSSVNHRVHERDEGFRAFEGETLLTHVLGLQEVLKSLGGVKLLQNVFLLRWGGFIHACFEVILQPGALVAVEDVGVFGTDFQSVGTAQRGEYIAQRHCFAVCEATNMECAVKVPDAQAVGGNIQVTVVWHWHSALMVVQRVNVSDEVTTGAVCLDELHDTGVFVYTGVG